jgi:hypothetical protein
MTKTNCLLRLFACLVPVAAAAGANAQELITNGNFEGAALAPWGTAAPAGTSVAIANESSPFQTIYAAGTRSVRITDDDVSFEAPSFQQSFSAQAGIRFAFDFKLAATAPQSAWYVIWSGEEDTTAFFFAIGGQDGTSFDFNQNRVATLEANMWYHVEGTADAPNQQIVGAIQNTRGERFTFSGGFPFGVQRVVSSVSVTDGDQGQNPAINFDNFSARAEAVALPSLSIVRQPDGQVAVSWTVAGYSLQASEQVGPNAQWQDIPTAGQTFITFPEQPTRFFRLVSE